MAYGLRRTIGNIAGMRIAAFAGVMASAALVGWMIVGVAAKGGDMTSQEFLDYIEREVFREDPFAKDAVHLAEFRTGHWSWDITQIINDYSGQLEPGETLAGVVDASFPLHVEHRRREEDGPMTGRAYEINRYHLDPWDTDHLKVYIRYYKPNVGLPFSGYRLVINIFRKRGEATETVVAYLFFDSL